MGLLESFVYGLLSGFAEILPVSAAAHQELMVRLFGMDGKPLAVNFLVHLAILVVLIGCCLPDIKRLRSYSVNGKRPRPSADSRLTRTAAVPLLLGFFLVPYIRVLEGSLPLLTLLLIANGLILYIPGRMLHGNKDARAMSALDSLLIGIVGVLGIVPGISRTGCLLSVSAARGADRQPALKWALLLSVPALLVLTVMDLVKLSSAGAVVAAGFLGSVIAIAGAAIGCYFGIKLLRYLSVKVGYSGFAYYSWGAALFLFVMYLTVV